ncbi:helix-turn-helix domain-containing protein [Candidatus Pacearchaeota archaeon]|nr:helix-turn-helix domain-containing protein [Candidatus Pacearchaeota archaeon]
MPETLSSKEAIEYLGIEKKEFENYFKSSGEIKGEKVGARFQFNKSDLNKWKVLKENRTVLLSLSEYEKCFEFAIKMAYSTRASHGTGIRGVRSEMQRADDFILGILAERGVQKFLKEKFGKEIKLDLEVHQDRITPQDFDGIIENGKVRPTKIDVAIKSSKWKNCWNIIAPIEYEKEGRKSDVYIFVRVGLPSDHLFRILKEHSFFKNVKEFLEHSDSFRKILTLKEIPIWVTGFSFHSEFEKVNEIPGQKFDGNPDYRYVKSVAKMHNSDEDWKDLIKRI